MVKKVRFGGYFQERRLALGLTLRKFCLEHGLDPGNLSRLERGLLPPPQDRAKLEEYAGFLKLRKGSSEWYEFFDLAAAEAGRIPKDILEDQEVVAKLPILFRTLRGEKVSDKKLNELIRTIRGRKGISLRGIAR